MFIMERIQKRYGDHICRRCINKVYHVNLKPQDCLYGYMMYTCRCCNEPHNIVMGLKLSGKLKTLFR